MALPADCVGCLFGNHDKHNPKEGHRDGVIGGYACNCKGDCAERHMKASESMAASLGLGPKPSSPDSPVPS